jgi:hypothetical protein
VITCPNCERVNPDTEKICTFCGELLPNANQYSSTRKIGDADYEEGVFKTGSARFTGRSTLTIKVEGADPSAKSFTFDADAVDELVIGREDPETHLAPDVDLANFGALEKGVSRRHARIVRQDGSLQIVDEGTPNGTYLNGQKLFPNQPRVLRDGDDVRLGHLVLRIGFFSS